MESNAAFLRNWNVLGIFKNKDEVARCVSVLRDHHYEASNISILIANEERKNEEHFLHLNKKTKNPESALTGFGIGSVLGIGLGAFLGSGLAPAGITLMGAGPFLSSLLGFGLGASVGAGIGGIIGHWVPEDDAYDYEKDLHNDEILLSVHVNNEDEALEAKDIFQHEGASKVLLNEKHAKYSESSVFPN